MLTQICHHIHNYFERSRHEGEYTIAGGTITLDFLTVGQRFRILGSAANDGIYTYHAAGTIWDDDNSKAVILVNETFTGAIIDMGVPREVIELAGEIAAWVTANAQALNSPFTSESFGGYSYQKASGGAGGTGGVFSWKDMFRDRLNAYRKIA